MANHVETLTTGARRAEHQLADARGVPRAGVVWRFCRRKPLGALGGLIVLALVVMAALAPWIAHYTFDETLRGARLKAPSAQFWMGTDNLGRDMWSRVVYGARVSVTVGFGAVLLANGLGAFIGVTSGYFGGKYDICVQRVVDAWQSFPFLVVILSIMAVLGPGLLNIVLALGVIGAANASRVIRGTTISVAENVYVESARAIGCGHLRIMVRHILPNVAGTIIVLATIGLGAFILAESALSFLGFGVPPPYPSWGGMLSGAGRSFFYQAPWMAIYPGLAISLTVFGFNMLGDALRDVLDPRLRGVGGRVR
jgi:peptide/nickel transport system permease protein